MSARMSAALSVADLLRRDEVGRAERLAGAVERRGPRPDDAWPGRAAQVNRALLDFGLGQAEVEHLDDRPVPFAAEHQVARLDVAVHHPRLMRMLQALRRLVNEDAGVRDGQRPLGLDQPGQVESLGVLHREDQAFGRRGTPNRR